MSKVGIDENEFHLICDCLNGIILCIDYLNCLNYLIMELSYCVDYEKVDKKWKVNFDGLKVKLLSLHYENILRLLIEVDIFWDNDLSREQASHKTPYEQLKEFLRN